VRSSKIKLLLWVVRDRMSYQACYMDTVADPGMGGCPSRPPSPHWPRVQIFSLKSLILGPSFVRKWTKRFQLQGALPLPPKRAVPWSPLGAAPPNTRYRLALLARHGPPPFAKSWIRPCMDTKWFIKNLTISLLYLNKYVRQFDEQHMQIKCDVAFRRYWTFGALHR